MTPKLREVSMADVSRAMSQQKLIERTPEEREKMKLELSELTSKWLQVDYQRRATMRDYNQEIKALRERMAKLDAAIKECR